MNHLVTDEQIASYERDGVVLLRNLFDTEWLEVLAEAIEQNLRQPSERTAEYVNDPSGNTHFFYDACAVGEVDGYDRLMMAHVCFSKSFVLWSSLKNRIGILHHFSRGERF